MDELDYTLPCPFCGEGLYLSIYQLPTGYYVMCDVCGASSGSEATRIDAVVKWNERVTLSDETESEANQ